MPEDSTSTGIKSQQVNPQSTGVVAPNQNDADRAQAGRAPNNAVRNKALDRSVSTWRKRVEGDDKRNFLNLKKLSTLVRYGKGMTRTINGHRWYYNPDEVKEGHDNTVAELKKRSSDSLYKAYGGRNKKSISLFKKCKGVLTTLKQYARRSAKASDVEKRIRGFANLKLFLDHGGDLHSTSRGDKLQRTIARIPQRVLQNASEAVTYRDYGFAEHLAKGHGRLPLLSFHGFKATGNWFSRGPLSRVYREKLRAITASALLLGGIKKAVKVKELLTEINKFPDMGKLGKKEDIVDRALRSLEDHGDLDTVISELNFELQRNRMAQKFNADDHLNKSGLIGGADPDFGNVGDELQKLDGLRNRVTVFENLNADFETKQDGYTLDRPHNLLRDLRFIMQPDPVRSVLKSSPNNAAAAQNAIYTWVNLMTQEGSAARKDIVREMERIEQSNSSQGAADIYLRVAKAFAAVEKSHRSVDDQCTLLMNCLKQPDKRQSMNLGRKFVKVEIDDDIKYDNDFEVQSDKESNIIDKGPSVPKPSADDPKDQPKVEEESRKKTESKAKNADTDSVLNQPAKIDIPQDSDNVDKNIGGNDNAVARPRQQGGDKVG